MKPRLLDLFCGAGGAAVGYHRAGFEVVGVDINPQPHYPFEFYRADALTFPLEGFDVIHASPPCQAHSAGARMRNGFAKQHPRLIEPSRARLRATGRPYVIENVVTAPLIHPTLLCGSSFGLGVRRHRLFESNVLLLAPGCVHKLQPSIVAVYGDHPENCLVRKSRPNSIRRAATVEEALEAMGTPWMETWAEVKEAIPPAFTEFLGTQLMAHLGEPVPAAKAGA